jgi:hypothetical protein
MDRDKIISMTDIKELRKYAIASFDTIKDLMDQKRLLEVEVSHLQELLRSVPSIPSVSSEKKETRLNVSLSDGMPDEVQAAMMQTAVLKAKATHTTLEFQETKQLESYHKILSSWRAEEAVRAKNRKSAVEALSDEELLKLVDSND